MRPLKRSWVLKSDVFVVFASDAAPELKVLLLICLFSCRLGRWAGESENTPRESETFVPFA